MLWLCQDFYPAIFLSLNGVLPNGAHTHTIRVNLTTKDNAMIALRQIQTLADDSVTIQLPPEFKNYQQAEIIILPLEESLKQPNTTESFIQRFAGALPDFPELTDTLLLEERDSWI